MAAEYNVNVPAPQNPTISYLTEDALGSVRIVTNSFGDVKARRDFLPFGEELFAGIGNRNLNQKYSANADDTRKKFATYQRDVETGLDYAQSRYYSPMTGRFTSPDEFKGGPDELFDFEDDASNNPTFYADLENPQSLNKYQYSYNNPYKYNDPTGHNPCCEEPKPVLGQVLFGPTIVEMLPIITPKGGGSSIAVPRGGTLVTPSTFGDPVVIIPYPGTVSLPRGRGAGVTGEAVGGVRGSIPRPMQNRRKPYSPPTPRNTGKNYPSRKRAQDASKDGRNRPKPTPKKDSPKRANWERNQNKFKPENHPSGKKPEFRRKHFHDQRKPENQNNKNRKPGEGVNNHNYYPNRF